MDSELTATSGSGTQTTTQSPQISAGSEAPTTGASSVQPGTATSLLNGSGGVALRGSALSTVDLGGNSAQTQTRTAPATATTKNPSHHANPVLLGFSIGLFVVALVICWLIAKPVKNTIK
ncbi:MAG: hypothetical protein WA843_03285 [Candidatus Saccharimonadales bacterium]